MVCFSLSLSLSLNSTFNTEIMSDPSYPGQWRVSGMYIEQVAKMTHWEYPEAVARFGRQLDALGISQELEFRGAEDGDLVMVDEYDFEFNSCFTNQYIPKDQLDREYTFDEDGKRIVEEEEEDEATPWRPYSEGGFLAEDSDELVGFQSDDWEFLDEDGDLEDGEFDFSEDEVWTSS
jgi:GTP-binding protein